MKKEKMSTYTIFMSEAIKSLCSAPPSRARVPGAGIPGSILFTEKTRNDAETGSCVETVP